MKSGSTKSALILLSFFIFFFSFWIILNLYFSEGYEYFDYFTDSYGIVAAIGGLLGYIASRKWGGFSSSMGRALVLFSFGLFSQFLGQLSYAIYYYGFGIENAYPSVGDIFYFGSIPLYICAIFQLFKVLQINTKLKRGLMSKFIAIIIPFLFIYVSYRLFLSDYNFDPLSPITAFLDYGYPLGAAIFVGLAIVGFLFSTSSLGGKLKNNVILLFIALVVHYAADTSYLYHTINETWRPGGIDDLFYLISYTAMGFTLISFGKAAEELTEHGQR